MVWVLRMKSKRYILVEWLTNPNDPYSIDWPRVESILGIDFTRWLNDLPRIVAQWYLYQNERKTQLVLEIYKDEIETEMLLRTKIVPKVSS